MKDITKEMLREFNKCLSVQDRILFSSAIKKREVFRNMIYKYYKDHPDEDLYTMYKTNMDEFNKIESMGGLVVVNDDNSLTKI